jgi:hypothetical protein
MKALRIAWALAFGVGLSAIVASGIVAQSCASLTPRQVVIQGVDVATKALQAVADAEHTLCDPSVAIAMPVLTCTATAHAMNLTDAVHQRISSSLATAAKGLLVYATALESGAGAADPSAVDGSLATTLTTIQAIPGVGGTIAGAILALETDVQTAIADWTSLKAQFSSAGTAAGS